MCLSLMQVLEISLLEWTSTDFAKFTQAIEYKCSFAGKNGPFKARVLGSNPSRLTKSSTYEFCHFHRTASGSKKRVFVGLIRLFRGEGPRLSTFTTV